MNLVDSVKLFNTVPVWSVALVIGVAGAIFVQFATKLHARPKYHWVSDLSNLCLLINFRNAKLTLYPKRPLLILDFSSQSCGSTRLPMKLSTF
jgi:hypothetical protein